jgi:hypothetical protein
MNTIDRLSRTSGCVFSLAFTVVVLSSTYGADAAGPGFSFAVGMGGPGVQESSDIAVDLDGNVFTVGFFEMTVDFDPGPGVANLTSSGEYDVFVQKLDSEGSFLWARSWGGTDYDMGRGIGVDASGSVYTTGFINGTVDLDPGPGTSMEVGLGFFVHKMDSDGNFLWGHVIEGAISEDVAVAPTGDVHTTGNFRQIVDFNPGVGTAILNGEDEGIGLFVHKMDSDGNFLWVKSFDRTGNISLFGTSAGVAVDGSGNVYTTGILDNARDFDPGPGVSVLAGDGFNDTFISKLGSNGDFVWARSLTGTNEGYDIGVDPSGNVYTLGNYGNDTDFDPGPGTFFLPGTWTYLLKLDSSGDFVWAINPGGSLGGSQPPPGMTLDSVGNVYTTGNLLRPGLVPDIFVQKLNPDGTRVWRREIFGPHDDFGTAVVVDLSGNVYSTGVFETTVDFDPCEGTDPLTSWGRGDIFVMKLTADGGTCITINLQTRHIRENERLEMTAPSGMTNYQWKKDGVLLSDDGSLTGTTSQVLIIDPLAFANSGVYTCQYDDGNRRSIVESHGYPITVLAASSALPVDGICFLMFLTASVLVGGSIALRRGIING